MGNKREEMCYKLQEGRKIKFSEMLKEVKTTIKKKRI